MDRMAIGCIADDYTGSSDAASFLKKGGLPTLLINGDAYLNCLLGEDTRAVVIALKTRSIEAAEAVRQSLAAVRWLLEQGAEKIYFKYCSTFDSTDKGNIGPVTDSLMELMDEPYTVLCPALPVNGRTVKDGILYVNGIPLGESHMRFHPLNPMTESKIENIMSRQSRYPCGTVDSRLLDSGKDKVKAYILQAAEAAGHATAVPDYFSTEQGARLAEYFADLRLLTGGSGLLEYIAGRESALERRDQKSHESPLPGRKLILAGSCSNMTQKQVAAYLHSGKKALRLNPEELISGRQKLEDVIKTVRETGEDLLVYSTAAPEEICRSGEGCDVSAMLEKAMGLLAENALEAGVKKLIVAGGETSGAVTRKLGFARFHIGEDAAPGVPVMTPLEREDIRLVLKSGNFGDEDFFLNTLD